MKRTILLISLLLTLNLHAELPPSVYENYQKNAPEVLIISVKKVETFLSSFNEKSVAAKAKVLRVIRSKSGLKKGDTITISYTTFTSRPRGWVGPSSLPVLEEEQKYKTFLKKMENNTYAPAARGKSFKYLKRFKQIDKNSRILNQ